MATRSGYAKVGRRQAGRRTALERLCTIPDLRLSEVRNGQINHTTTEGLKTTFTAGDVSEPT
jgi:hypothetical protein